MKRYKQKLFLKILLSLALLMGISTVCYGEEIYLDINSYLRYGAGRGWLLGAGDSLTVKFRFCNDRGMLMYQEDAAGFFAMGINQGRVYLEWKTSDRVIELYIGDGSLQPNTLYTVTIYGLSSRTQTQALINGQRVTVDYLVTVDTGLNMGSLQGNLYIGGYPDVSQLKVNTERLTAYLITCIESIETKTGQLNLQLPTESVGAKQTCPQDFCASPTMVTMETSLSYISLDIPLPPRTQTIITLRFRTRANSGLLFYYGGPAYLAVFMSTGGMLGLALNTRGSGSGEVARTSLGNYNDGNWHFIRVVRNGNSAELQDEASSTLASVEYGTQGDTAQSLNAAELFIGGVRNPALLPDLPSEGRFSLRGCFEAPRFVSYSITSEPPPLLNLDTQVKDERAVRHGGCFPESVCEPACPIPQQMCNFSCSCAPGFTTVLTTPQLVCQNVDDCAISPCQHGGICVDRILDYDCQCPIEWNRGKNCELPNNCHPSPCSNGGSCVNMGDGYRCNCAPGFTGVNCTQEIDECVSMPCQNMGTCIDQIGRFLCFCSAGYTGATCEQDIDECESNPCLNGGQCNNFVNGYSCTCPPGWKGLQCHEDIDECLSQPCSNGAQCIDEVNAFTCICSPGYTGSLCESEIDECSFGLCQNGASCTDALNAYVCTCAPGWMGKNCDQDILECISAPCRNGAFCVDGINTFSCNCAQGFEGRLCEINIDECDSQPCQNGGGCKDGVNQYSCQCLQAWSGPHCELEVNECTSNPCQNGGICQDFLGRYSCRCSSGFTGTNCEIDIDECASRPCLNGATCEDFPNYYTCSCAPGYAGQFCQIDLDECQSRPCANGGSCRDLVNGFQCTCRSGFSGERCELDIDECLSNPCLNEGICQDRVAGYLCACPVGFTGVRCEVNINDCNGVTPHRCENGGRCVDGINSYTCECRPGWTGQYCNSEIDECASSPCRNGAPCTDMQNGFRCACPPTFTGARCEVDVDECVTTRPCQNYVSCNNTYGSYVCQCLPGFTGRHCEEDVNECESQPCYFGGTCHDAMNGYTCTCATGFMGDQCEAVIRSCQFHHPCGDNAVCVEKERGGYECFCEPGFNGPHCEFEVDECLSNPCYNGGICTDLVNGYNCTCMPGYTGPNCKVDIDECSSQPCQNGGQCLEPEVDMFTCVCVVGFTGPHCEVNIDECSSNPCPPFQHCKDLVNAYSCECPTGLSGERCDTPINRCYRTPCLNGGTCMPIGSDGFRCECPYPFQGNTCEIDTDPCLPNPCLHFGTCYYDNRLAEGFKCACVSGFIGDRCEGDIHECLSRPCMNGGSCVEHTDGLPGFECICSDDYAGALCELDKTTCAVNNCQNEATCIVTPSGPSCLCPSGWTGDFCQDNINECLVLRPCRNGGACIDAPGSYQCVCNKFFMGRHCEQDVEECATDPCLNGATCVENLGAEVICLCLPGFTGALCEAEISECSSQPCQNQAQCEESVGSYTCHCLPGYTGLHCETNIDECDSSPCQNEAACMNLLAAYRCICRVGFTGTNCETNMDECASRPCLNGATCVDQENGYACQCVPGYSGSRCESDINECQFQPCQNGAVCHDELNKFRCECLPGWTGPACSVEVDECGSAPCLNGASCENLLDQYRCVCAPGFTGNQCETDIDECASSPCLNGGQCEQPETNKFRCRCPTGVEGDRCETVLSATFNGESYFQVPSLDSLGKLTATSNTTRHRRAAGDIIIIVGFFIETSFDEGILLLATGTSPEGHPQHLGIQLLGGTLVASADIGSEAVRVSLPLIPVNGIYVGEITLTAKTLGLEIQFAGESCISGCFASVDASQTGGLALNGPLYLGHVPTMSPYLRSKLGTTRGFTGCLGNLKVNGLAISLGTAAPPVTHSLKRSATSGPQPGCAAHVPCQIGYCRNSGVCVDNWTNKECNCRPGFHGDKCEQTAMTHFEPSSFLHIPGQGDMSQLTLWFTATAPSGILLYTLTSNPVCILLENGALRVHLVVSGGDVISELAGNFTDGAWYQVLVALSRNQMITQVRNLEINTIKSDVQYASTSIAVQQPAFLGTLHNDPVANLWRNRPQSFPTFDSVAGCIRDLTINSRPVDFNTATPSDLGNDPRPPMPGCPREDHCWPDPCQNDGMCNATWLNYTCNCKDDYVGLHCQSVSSSTFNGKTSYIEAIINTSVIAFGHGGSFEFRTQADVGRLLFLDMRPLGAVPIARSLEFQVFQGQFQVAVRSASEATRTLPSPISDGAWHKVFWEQEGHNLVVKLDNLDTATLSNTDLVSDAINRQPVVTLYLGARPFVPGQINQMVGYFEGCIRDLRLNSERIHYLEDEAQEGIQVTNVGVLSGCNGNDVCAVNPCPPNAFCKDIWNDYACECLAGWEGPLCAESINDCRSDLCLSGATCIDGHQNYTCVCPPGYTGRHCELIIQACDAQPCHPSNSIGCTPQFPEDYICICRPGFSGKNCAQDKNDCISSPCMNGGTCQDYPNGYGCLCGEMYFGEICQFPTPCASSPCFNSGSCRTTPDNSNYSCECLPPFTGHNCETRDYCSTHVCRNSAVCQISGDGYICVNCPRGFHGDFCQYIDACMMAPCRNGGTCQQAENSYICVCPSHYTGQQCESAIDRCNSNPCFNGGSCFFDLSNPVRGYVCECVQGWTGLLCESDINECSPNPCLNGAICQQVAFTVAPGGYRCVCVPGYSGLHCESDIFECASQPCLNGGACLEGVNSHSCQCLPGYSGSRCEQDVRGCNSMPCQNEGMCYAGNNPGSYYCSCLTGFTGQHCESNIDECLSNPCQNNGECLDQVAGYRCVCKPGSSGPHCESIINACYSQPCLNNGTCRYTGLCSCVEVVGQCGVLDDLCQQRQCSLRPTTCTIRTRPYDCDCQGTGYEGTVCELDVDECKPPNLNPCLNRGKCQNVLGGYKCDCSNTGFRGDYCEEDIDECREMEQPCYNGGTCLNYPGMHICECVSSWTGPRCQQWADPCSSNNPCVHGICRTGVPGSFMCDCDGTGYRGDQCQEDVDECTELAEPCFNGGTCRNYPGFHICLCPSEWTGHQCQQWTNPCASSPCHFGKCSGGVSGYTCNCTGTRYKGTHCEVEINECEEGTHLCKNDATCVFHPGHGYNCTCSTTFKGETCEEPVTLGDSSRNTALLIVGILLLLIIVLAVIIYCCWYQYYSRKYKGKYKPAEVEKTATPPVPLALLLAPDTRERLV